MFSSAAEQVTLKVKTTRWRAWQGDSLMRYVMIRCTFLDSPSIHSKMVRSRQTNWSFVFQMCRSTLARMATGEIWTKSVASCSDTVRTLSSLLRPRTLRVTYSSTWVFRWVPMIVCTTHAKWWQVSRMPLTLDATHTCMATMLSIFCVYYMLASFLTTKHLLLSYSITYM